MHLQTSEHLETTISQWSEFETQFDNTITWLKDSELKLKDVDLKSTLPEKKEQHEKIRVMCEDSSFEIHPLCLIILWNHTHNIWFLFTDSQ